MMMQVSINVFIISAPFFVGFFEGGICGDDAKQGICHFPTIGGWAGEFGKRCARKSLRCGRGCGRLVENERMG